MSLGLTINAQSDSIYVENQRARRIKNGAQVNFNLKREGGVTPESRFDTQHWHSGFMWDTATSTLSENRLAMANSEQPVVMIGAMGEVFHIEPPSFLKSRKRSGFVVLVAVTHAGISPSSSRRHIED
jgi:hypothetical protein